MIITDSYFVLDDFSVYYVKMQRSLTLMTRNRVVFVHGAYVSVVRHVEK